MKVKMSFGIEVLVEYKEDDIDESKFDDKEILKQGSKLIKDELQSAFFYSDEEQTVLDFKVKKLKIERVE
jgi:hypothetical protein